MAIQTTERTGKLATLLPPLSACDRGSQVIHAAEERLVYIGATGDTMAYSDLTALCGEPGWGAAERPVAETTCARCRRTKRFREVVFPAGLVSGETTGSPQDREPDHGGCDA